MKFQLVQRIADLPALDGGLDSMICDDIAAIELRGFALDGERCGGQHLREELRGQPCFKGLAGPMWGGHDDNGEPIIRYEEWSVYELLSR
jgi:hypothetical protein